eukprot:scaffold32557_cov99-Isochrysis_galbana.AAC.2
MCSCVCLNLNANAGMERAADQREGVRTAGSVTVTVRWRDTGQPGRAVQTFRHASSNSNSAR